MTAMLMMFVFMGLLGGYFSARLYKSFRGEEWKKTTLRTAMLFPGAWCGGQLGAVALGAAGRCDRLAHTYGMALPLSRYTPTHPSV